MPAFVVALCGCLAALPSFGAHYRWDQNHDPFGTQTSPPPDGNGPSCNPAGSPFEVATGNYFYRYEDFSAAVLGPELRFVRSYNSRDLRSGSLGVGWTHNYDIRLLDLTDGVTVTALCRKGTGKRFRFQRKPDGSYEPPSDFYSELVELPGGGFSLKEVDGTKMLFGADGLLTAIEDSEGHQLTLVYDATGFLITITSTAGAQIILTKGADGKIATATDPRGKVFEYGYDTEGRLTSVTNPLDEVTTFVYGANGNLEGILDSLARTVQDLSYDGEERLTSYIEDGVTWTVDYSPGESKATKTNPLGEAWVVYYNENGNVVQQVVPLGGELEIGYDANWRPTTFTDQRDSQWVFLYDQFGNVTRVVDPLTNPTDFLYDPSGELLELVTYPSGRVVDPSYGPDGRLSGISDAEGDWFTVLEYNGDGTIGRVADANGQVWTYRYDGQSHFSELESPMGSITRFEVDVVGDLQAFVDADGHRFELRTDDLGRPEKIIDPDLEETIFEYAPSCPTCIEDRLLSLVRDASGREFRWNYDSFGRLTQTVRGGSETVDFGYDGQGLLDSITDPRGIQTTLAYDERGLLETVAHPDAGVTTYGFDPAANLVQIDDAEGHTTSRILDAVGRTESVTSPEAGLTEFTYTPEGLRKTRTDARQVTAAYSYDGRARLLGLSFADPADNVSFAWDEPASENGGGRLTSLSNASGNRRYHYDLDGRLKRVETDIGGVADSTTYAYSAGDRLQSLTYPSGIRVDYLYDSRGLVESVNLVDAGQTSPVISSALYDEAGRLESWTHGNGLAETWVFDPKGRVQSITAGSAHQVSYGRGLAGRVTSMTDLLDPSLNRTYGYDDAGRLTDATGPWGTISYGYDLVGNRTSRTEGACVTSYQYTDNRLSTLSGCESGSYQYDPAGNTLSDGTLEYEYNQLGRLDRVLDGGVEVASYTYNAANQRVKKETASETVFYHYGPVGNLLEETDTQGNSLAAYIYLPGGRPLAQVIGGELFHYHLDQLATPRRLTDALGAIAWSAELLPFGAVWQEVGTTDQRLRFQGQLYDAESGLHYNWHRFYDPTIGRYLRADPAGPHEDWLVSDQQRGRYGGHWAAEEPIRLADRDTNPYAYVVDDPVNWTDPLGLMKLPATPEGLPPEWEKDLTHNDPKNPPRRRHPSGNYLDFHRGQEGKPRHQGKDHWHLNKDDDPIHGDDHLYPGDEIPDFELPEEEPKPPWWHWLPKLRGPGTFDIFLPINPCYFEPYLCGQPCPEPVEA